MRGWTLLIGAIYDLVVFYYLSLSEKWLYKRGTTTTVLCTFSNILVTTVSGGRSQSTRREPPTMGKQLVNFITCGW
jgi:hypothetical protein